MHLRISLSKRKHILKVVALSCTIFAVLNEISWEPIHTVRILTVDTVDAVDAVDAVDDSCALEPPREPPLGTIPIIAASYPGSGAKMTWNLIEGLTGFWTGDEWFLNGRTSENVVSIKTHYPHSEGRLIPHDVKIQGALLLVRHPMDAIPSYHNYLYEVENKFPPHSLRAPVDEWTTWRDLHFEDELMKWKQSIIYWMDAIPSEHRLVMFYEKIVDEETGPLEALKLSEFLDRSHNVNAVGEKRARCVWQAIVRYHEAEVEAENAENEILSRRRLLEKNKKMKKMKSSLIQSDLSLDPLLVTDAVEQEQEPETPVVEEGYSAGYLTVPTPQMTDEVEPEQEPKTPVVEEGHSSGYLTVPTPQMTDAVEPEQEPYSAGYLTVPTPQMTNEVEPEQEPQTPVVEEGYSSGNLTVPTPQMTDAVEPEHEPETPVVDEEYSAGHLTVPTPQVNPNNMSLITDETQMITSDAQDPVSIIDNNASFPAEQHELEIPSLMEDAPVEEFNNYRPNPASLRIGPKDKPFSAEQCGLILKVVRELIDTYDGTELADYLSVYYVGRIYHSNM